MAVSDIVRLEKSKKMRFLKQFRTNQRAMLRMERSKLRYLFVTCHLQKQKQRRSYILHAVFSDISELCSSGKLTVKNSTAQKYL